jgi:hypothetical protein
MTGRSILRVIDSNQERATPSGIWRIDVALIARRIPMMDVVMLALAFVFFALSIGYVYACDRL